MRSAHKRADCEIDFQESFDGSTPDGFACYECLLCGDRQTTYMKHELAAITHLQAHVAAGHMVPHALVLGLQERMHYRSLVHQSGMSPLRRHDGTLSGSRELAFHRQWLLDQTPFCTQPLLKALMSSVDLGPVTQRDATLAASIMQWLGTNVGFCFLESALKACGYKIVEVQREKRYERAQEKRNAEAISELLSRGAEQAVREDHQGETKSGWWQDTVWLAPYSKPVDALEAIKG